jgi:hypothetical protein
MVNENGLKEPPPPAIVTFAVPVTAQVGMGLGEGLALGDGLGLGEGLGVWASVWVAPIVRKIAPRVATAHRFQNGRVACGACAAAWFRLKIVMISSRLVFVEGT